MLNIPNHLTNSNYIDIIGEIVKKKLLDKTLTFEEAQYIAIFLNQHQQKNNSTNSKDMEGMTHLLGKYLPELFNQRFN